MGPKSACHKRGPMSFCLPNANLKLSYAKRAKKPSLSAPCLDALLLGGEFILFNATIGFIVLFFIRSTTTGNKE